MHSNILVEVTSSLEKLYLLEESIISEEKMDHHDLRSKQALLISEVIESLQDLERTVKQENRFTVMQQHDSFIRL